MYVSCSEHCDNVSKVRLLLLLLYLLNVRSGRGGELKYRPAVPEDRCDKKDTYSAVLLLKD